MSVRNNNSFLLVRDWLKSIKWFNDSIIAKSIFVLVVMSLVFIPAYLAGLLWWLVSPSGFWQIFAIVALSVFFFGSAQIWLLVVGIGMIVVVLAAEAIAGKIEGMEDFEKKYTYEGEGDDWNAGHQ